MGYRIDIDHAGCINCGICMDTCPVEALDMSRPEKAGVETGGLGSRQPWMMEHPVQVGECIGCGICIGECPVVVMTLVAEPGETALAPRQGPIERPVAPAAGRQPWLPLAASTRESLKREHPVAVGRPASLADRRPDPGLAGLAVDEGDRTAGPDRALPGRLPGRHRRRSLRRPDRRRSATTRPTRSRPRSIRSRRSVAGSAPPRARSVCRRGVLDEPIAIRTLKRFAAEHGRLPAGRPAGGPRDREGRDRRRRTGRHVRRLLPGPARLPGHRLRGHAGPGRDDGHRHPSYRLPRDVLQAEIARIVEPRRRPPAERGDGPRLHARGPRDAGLPGGLPGHRRLEEPPARRPGRRRSRRSSRRPSSSSGSTSVRSRV